MAETREESPLLSGLVGQVVVVDLRAHYVCLGTLVGFDSAFLEIRDADLHDFRDGTATREVYVYDSFRVGVRRNRARLLLRRDEVVAVARLGDISET